VSLAGSRLVQLRFPSEIYTTTRGSGGATCGLGMGHGLPIHFVKIPQYPWVNFNITAMPLNHYPTLIATFLQNQNGGKKRTKHVFSSPSCVRNLSHHPHPPAIPRPANSPENPLHQSLTLILHWSQSLISLQTLK